VRTTVAAMEPASCPLMNPFLEVSDFDADSAKPMALCTLPTSAGDPVRFALPAAYLEVVRCFDGQRTTEAAIDEFLIRHPDAFARDWLQRLVEKSLLPKGILVYSDQDAGRVAVSQQSKRGFLYIKLPIIPPCVVDPIARLLGFMFRPVALVLGLVLFVASHVVVYGDLIRHQDVDFNRLNAGSILVLMLLSTLGTFCHEFGHATAAAHYGCRRITIGWGLYLIYTVLWTNVSEAWKLPRRQRAIVDIGGVYFESLFMLALVALYVYTGNAIYLFAFMFTDFSIATTFNPFLRMDGYWLMSDLFGIVNLRKQQLLWLSDILARRSGGAAPAPSGLTKRASWVLGVYTVLGMLFMGYLLTVVYQLVILKIVANFPATVEDFWTKLHGGVAVLDVLGALLEIAWRTMIIVGAALMLWGLLRRVISLVAGVRSLRATAVGGSA
jgi:putative peptide zinc metalloprotease protein